MMKLGCLLNEYFKKEWKQIPNVLLIQELSFE